MYNRINGSVRLGRRHGRTFRRIPPQITFREIRVCTRKQRIRLLRAGPLID
jgi:hypothetical protein